MLALMLVSRDSPGSGTQGAGAAAALLQVQKLYWFELVADIVIDLLEQKCFCWFCRVFESD